SPATGRADKAAVLQPAFRAILARWPHRFPLRFPRSGRVLAGRTRVTFVCALKNLACQRLMTVLAGLHGVTFVSFARRLAFPLRTVSHLSLRRVSLPRLRDALAPRFGTTWRFKHILVASGHRPVAGWLVGAAGEPLIKNQP